MSAISVRNIDEADLAVLKSAEVNVSVVVQRAIHAEAEAIRDRDRIARRNEAIALHVANPVGPAIPTKALVDALQAERDAMEGTR